MSSFPPTKESKRGRGRSEYVPERRDVGGGKIDADLLPTADEKDALVGTSGAPSGANKYVTNGDSRLSDQRDAKSLQGRTLATDAPADADVLTWDNAQSRWEPRVAPSAGAAGGAATVQRTFFPETTGTTAAADGPTGIWLLRDAQSDEVVLHFEIPKDYNSGDLTFKLFLRPASGTGNVRLRRNRYRARSGAALATQESNVDSTLTLGVAGQTEVYTFTVSAADFQAGDVIKGEIIRLGNDAADTLAALAVVDGASVEYKATVGGVWKTRNLVVENDAVTPASKVKVTADEISIEDVLASTVSVTVDITVAGANGLDAGAEAASTWYAVWLIFNPSTSTVASLLSTSFSAPIMPAGYTKKRRVGAVRNDAASNFLPFMQRGDLVLYNEVQNENRILTAGIATVFTDVSAASFIPSVSRRGYFHYIISISHGTANVSFALSLRTKGAPGITDGRLYPASSQVANVAFEFAQDTFLDTDASQVIQYKIAAAPGAGGIYIDVLGYQDPVL